MNLNDFVVLSNNKAKSVKLNVRNLQELQMETVTLAQESNEMEDKLQQLKESMSKEKQERGHFGGFRWKSGQGGSLNRTKNSEEKMLQKLSTGKVKIRVLKDEALTAPNQPPPPLPTIKLQTTRKSRLRGTDCGQCEVKTAGLMCAECSEDYCIGCFAKFHQKGALKLHRMIPIQTDLQTHVTTRDIVNCFQTQINPSCLPGTFTSLHQSPNSKPGPSHTIKSNTVSRGGGDQKSEKGTEASTKSMRLHPHPSQVLAANHGEEPKVEMIEEGLESEAERGFPTALLRGEYNEEESARFFQEAIRQWRGEKSDRAGELITDDAVQTPGRPVSVSAMATQADITPDQAAEGRGRGGCKGMVLLEFTENSLTYTDRLLLKKLHRTPMETYHPLLASCTDSQLLPNTDTEEETALSLKVQEEDFRRYYASLFAVHVSRGRTEPQIITPESCLTIEVLDERDRDGDFVAEQRTHHNREVPSAQNDLSKGRSLVLQTAITSSESSRMSCSSASPTQPFRQSRAPAKPKAAQKPHLSKPQTSQAESPMKSSSTKSKPSARPTAETPRTSKTSIKTPTLMPQKPNWSPTVHKSKPDHGSPPLLSCPSSPHFQTDIPKSSQASVSFPPDVTSLACNRSPISEEHLFSSPSMPFSLRSTYTISPSSSTESILLPKVYQSPPLQKDSDSSLPPEQPQFSKLFPEPFSLQKLSQSSSSNLESSRQSQQSICEPEYLLLDNHPELPLSPVSSSQHPPSESLEQCPPLETLSILSHNESPPYSRHRSLLTNEDTPVFMSSTPIAGDHESTQSLQNALLVPSLPSHLLNVFQNPGKMKEEEELSIDSEDEMSSDSLGLAPHEEDSSDEEAQMHRHSTRERSREEQQGNQFIHAGREKAMQTDEKEQLSEPSTVMHKQSAGSGSEHFCDLDGLLPQGLDLNSGHSITPECTHCDAQHTRQTSPYDSDSKGSEGYWPSSSHSTYTQEHLVSRMMMDNHMQPAGIQIHSAITTRAGEISANELGTGAKWSNLAGKSTPTLSACCPSRAMLGSELGLALRPLSRVAKDIMEICNVDQAGCEDPDLDDDTAAHTLHELEGALRLMTKGTHTHIRYIHQVMYSKTLSCYSHR
uniref:zinc finger B-box domain-containing protein 1 isoform X2 n=1 Tax=Scatophagus argus TaxID=75038 RepID=UPI001ED84B3A|nr:zinc finger B-box domain-containing protein 1 isoform X2 [Scatophagus argus]